VAWRRLILSRKGFDSGYGGRPSPILPSGVLASLPIPEAGGVLRYSECEAPTGETYQELLLRLGIERIRDPAVGASQKWLDVRADPCVHLDPDLYQQARKRDQGWRPLFGQVGVSQTHLAKHHVGPGDLFLFFGWFSPVDEVAGQLRYRPRSEQCHVIFGWLEVEVVVGVGRDPIPHWAREHPHVRLQTLPRFRLHNTLYVAAESSSLVTGLAGGGTLCWSPDRQLTKPGSTPSIWRLPKAFHPDYVPLPLTRHSRGAWDLDGDYATLRSTRIGQEFIVAMTPAIEAWVQTVLNRRP
jgi:hypothetical protein